MPERKRLVVSFDFHSILDPDDMPGYLDEHVYISNVDDVLICFSKKDRKRN